MMRDELRNFGGSAQELRNLFKPFTELSSPTTALRFLDKYLEQNPENPYEDNEGSDTIEAYQTLIRNGEIDSYEALNAITGDAFKYAVETGFIERGPDKTLALNDTTLTQFYLTTKGWKTLEDSGEVNLERWDNTIEIEQVGSDFQLNPTGKGSRTVNTFSLPRHLNLSALWEDGMMHIEPSPHTALVHFRNDNYARLVGTE